MIAFKRYCPQCGCPLFDEETTCPDCSTNVDNKNKEMKRPDYREYSFEHVLIRDSVYIEDLDQYCDDLEKALDRACDKLEEKDSYIHYLLKKLDVEHRVTTSKKWKEWCLKDE